MKHVDLVGTRRHFFWGSGITFVLSLIFLALWGLRPGIEFTSGTTALIAFDATVSQEDLRAVYTDLGHGEARIQSTGANEYLIRTSELQVPEGAFTEVEPEATDTEGGAIGPNPLPEVGTAVLGADDAATGDVELFEATAGDLCTFGESAATEAVGAKVTVNEVITTCPEGTVYRVTTSDGSLGLIAADDTHDFVEAGAEEEGPEESPVTENAGERTVIEQRLFEEFGDFDVLEFASVTAVVSSAAARNAAVAVVVSCLFIMAYVAFAFSSLPNSRRYATCAIVALAHDVVIVLGAFALFGEVFGTEINLMFVTGLLTVIGFSVHDTIVVFDRVRENVRSAPGASLAENVNAALLQTMARSMNTSLTVLLTVAAMLALGGVTIQEFLLVILVGVAAGVYSSIGIASQLLVSWEEGDFGRLFRRGRAEPQQTA